MFLLSVNGPFTPERCKALSGAKKRRFGENVTFGWEEYTGFNLATLFGGSAAHLGHTPIFSLFGGGT